MSGPATADDAAPIESGLTAEDHPTLEVHPGRQADVGGIPVRRALPTRGRRTVGAWCFADHFGSVGGSSAAMRIGPHPHTSLHTVTWLVEGEVLHTDSVGSEQVIRPGQLNLMTAGRGVSHAEESTDPDAPLHGVQLWIAQPEATRDGPPAFEHHAELPTFGVEGAEVTVLVGAVGDVSSPARADTALVGAEVSGVSHPVVVPLVPSFEHALVVLDGVVEVDGARVEPGVLAYLGEERAELHLDGDGDGARVLLLGGEPFTDPIVMWWNFVGRSRHELAQAYDEWQAASERFGPVRSPLDRIPAPRPTWR
jgi:quercetin 2,3-dioxygenase